MEINLNESSPLVSVITPVYNSERFISKTIKSVQVQTFQSWEMVIVDDCSTDNTVSIIQHYQKKDSRIKLIQLSENKGPAVARNTAINYAVGRYLAFLDGDDQWTPNKLKVQLEFMHKYQIAFSFTKYKIIDENGNDTGNVIDIPNQVNYKELLKDNIIGCLTVMLDTDKIGKVQMIDIRSRQDYVLWLTLLKRGYQAYGIQEVLAKYRIVGNSLSSNKLKMAKQNWKVYREVEKLSFFKSAWNFMFYIFYKLKKYSN